MEQKFLAIEICSVAQVRDCAAQLTRMAKQQGVTVVMIGHVTKEGALAVGSRTLSMSLSDGDDGTSRTSVRRYVAEIVSISRREFVTRF